MKLRQIEDLELTNKKVFLRLDLNVPIKNGVIQDDTRIKAALPTIKHILKQTNKLAMASHLGRPKGDPKPEFSLEPIGARLCDLLGKEVVFVKDYGKEPIAPFMDKLTQNQLVLLENVRFHPGETKNDLNFSENLAKGFDFYVDDAFGAIHRAHASVVGVAEYFSPEKRAAGYLIQEEVCKLNELLERPEHPFTVIMGGAKVSDKMDVILNMINKCNNLIIGGAMAYTFLKYQGKQVGKSQVEEDKMDLLKTIYKNAESRKVSIYLPKDHVVAAEFKDTSAPTTTPNESIPDNMMGLDIGPQTIASYTQIINKSKTIFWNGPMGVFEWAAFNKGTFAVAKALGSVQARTFIGGGDSVSAVNKSGMADKMFHISTGGGASLEYLEGKTLPGLKVLYK